MSFTSVKTFLINHKVIALVILVVLLMVLSFSGGRYSAPTKTITKTEIQTVDHIVTQVQTQTVVKTVYVTAENKDIHQTTDTIKHPDGTVETKVVVDDQSKTTTSDVIQASSQFVEKEKEDKTVDSKSLTITENAKPQWHFALRVGAGAQFGLNGVSPQGAVGLSAERRILGPVWMGLWVNGQAPITGFPTAPPYSVTGGLSVGFEL